MIIIAIHLINFESHKDTLIEFEKGINVLFGISDVGKSSIIRAFKWVLTNRPAADSVRRIGSKKTEVRIDTINGNVTRIKSDDENKYIVNDITILGFGRKVPEEVFRILNVSSTNLQLQFSPHYLLSDKPSAVTKTLNRISNMDHALEIIGYLNKRKNSTSRDLKTKKKEEARLKEEIDNSVWVRAQLREINGMMDDHYKYIRLVNQCKKTEMWIKSLKEAKRKLSEYEPHRALIVDIRKIEKDLEELKNLNKKVNQVYGNLMILKNSKEELVSRYKIRSRVTVLRKLEEKWDKQNTKVLELKAWLDELREIKQKLNNQKIAIDRFKEELNKYEMCPLCGQEVESW
jgi:DNA repair exonuclease SbcCD ATPase subunit